MPQIVDVKQGRKGWKRLGDPFGVRLNEATKSLDQKLIANYMHRTTFDTIAGPMTFGPTGEQPGARVLLIQYQGIEGNAIDQFKLPGKQVIIFPPGLRSGEFKYPFSDIKR